VVTAANFENFIFYILVSYYAADQFANGLPILNN